MDFSKLLGTPRNQVRDRAWFSMNLAQSGEAEIFIYDFIGFDPFFGGVSAQAFVEELRSLNANKILLRINSPGGDIAEANAIRTALAEHPAEIETHIDGIAASSASWVGLVADKVVMSPHSMMMIHEPWNVIAGDAKAMAKEAEVLNKYGDEIARMLSEKAGGTVDEWRDLMREETWYTDQEAVDAGLADEVSGEATAENRYDTTILNVFKHTPKELLPAKRKQRARSQPKATQPETDDGMVQAALEYQRGIYQRITSQYAA